MKDYLSKLIQRSQAPEVSIHPRPIARFEPIPSRAETAPALALEDLGANKLEFDGQGPSRPSESTTFDSLKHPRSDISNPGAEFRAIHTIAIPRESVSLHAAEKISHTGAPAERKPPGDYEPGSTLGSDASLPAKGVPEAGFQVRPANIRLMPESGHSETVAPRQSGWTAQPPEPDINVTIGRVEVRAVMPPEKRTVARPKRIVPSQTLDDYLKKREA